MQQTIASAGFCLIFVTVSAMAQVPDEAARTRAAALQQLQEKLTREKAEAEEVARAAAARRAETASLVRHARAAPLE
jgi:tRNA A37 methylthiotransferase MiaB